MQYALQPANTEILQILIDAGADVHELDSALFGCCEDHNLEQMRQLIELGVDPNDADDGKVMDCVHKNRDHYFEEVWTLTSLGYALRYEWEYPGCT